MLEWLPVAALADACVRHGRDSRVPAPGLRPVKPGWRLAGPALPVHHAGSVDAFLEAIERAEPGDVLVVDNALRQDEACVGDLVALDAKVGGLAGLVVSGFHRDTAELVAIGLPVFSYGAHPVGPRAPRPRPGGTVTLGGVPVGPGDVLVADDDGTILVPPQEAPEVWRVARALWRTERAQADKARAGVSMREQLRFRDYLDARARDPALTFRAHLRRVGAAIEE